MLIKSFGFFRVEIAKYSGLTGEIEPTGLIPGTVHANRNVTLLCSP
jgi:hypothetical protein